MTKYQYVITAMKKLYDTKIVRSYTEMSQKLNVSRQYISQILIGRVKPSDEFIKALSTTFPEIKSDLLKGHIELFPDKESFCDSDAFNISFVTPESGLALVTISHNGNSSAAWNGYTMLYITNLLGV